MPHQILIVEAQTAERQALERYLSHDLGYTVTAVPGATPALEAALATTFDLAIISAHLDEVSGIESYIRLRSIQNDLQAVFFAGDDDLKETDRDFLRFSVPAERVMPRPNRNYAQLTRLMISILGPPTA